MSLTNHQAALIAAASQDGQWTSVPDVVKRTLMLAREYVTWLDQQDELEKRLGTASLEPRSWGRPGTMDRTKDR